MDGGVVIYICITREVAGGVLYTSVSQGRWLEVCYIHLYHKEGGWRCVIYICITRKVAGGVCYIHLYHKEGGWRCVIYICITRKVAGGVCYIHLYHKEGGWRCVLYTSVSQVRCELYTSVSNTSANSLGDSPMSHLCMTPYYKTVTMHTCLQYSQLQ